MVKIPGSNRTNFNYIFGGQLDVFGKLNVDNDTTINGNLKVTGKIEIDNENSILKLTSEDFEVDGIIKAEQIIVNSATFQDGEYTGAGISTFGDIDMIDLVARDVSLSTGLDNNGYFTSSGVDDGQNTSLTGTQNFTLHNGMHFKFDTQPAGNWTPNFRIRAPGSTNAIALVDRLKDGNVCRPTIMVRQRSAGTPEGVTLSGVQIDGTATGVTVEYEGGITPPASPGTGYDFWEFFITRTNSDDDNPTYHVYVKRRKINTPDYRPGEIIETLQGVCDGNDVTVQSGTYTLANVNADQVLTNSHATISGSSIEYTPPAGTTRVCYEFWVYMKDTGSGNNSRPLLHFRSQLDNSSGTATVINNSRHTWRYTHPVDLMDVQTWIYNKVIVSIGQVTTESVANGRLVSWDDARTFRWQARRYSSSYGAQLHETNHYDGAGTDVRVRPHVKITAIA
jgi:hypothetical protein